MSSEIKTIVEALLFVADSPLSLAQIAQVLENEDKAQIKQALQALEADYQSLERAFTLVEVAGGFCLRTRPEMAYWLRRLRRQQVTRLSRPALETLAIVAYKQPVLKAEIERLRGVEVGGILRTLLHKDLIRVVGRKDLPGRPLIYGTTRRFLEVFDLKSLGDLPTLKEIEELGGEGELNLFSALPAEAQPESDQPEEQPLEDLPHQAPEQAPEQPQPEPEESGGPDLPPEPEAA